MRKLAVKKPRCHEMVALRWGHGGGPLAHHEAGKVAIMICLRCGRHTSKCCSGLGHQCPRVARPVEARDLRKVAAGWHPRRRAALEVAGLANHEALLQLEEAERRQELVE
eukprot:9808303-Lingulodinium_polyedra.AAC.1